MLKGRGKVSLSRIVAKKYPSSFVWFLLKMSSCVLDEGMILSQDADHRAGFGLTSLPSSSSHHGAIHVLLPSPKDPSIHPSNREVRQDVWPLLLASQNLRVLLTSVFFFSLLLTFGEHSSGVILGYPEPLTGRTKARTRLCLLLVRLADWLTTIHDHWFAGCAFGRRAPDKFRHRLPDVVQ